MKIVKIVKRQSNCKITIVKRNYFSQKKVKIGFYILESDINFIKKMTKDILVRQL